MKKQKGISRRCFLRNVGALCVGVSFFLLETSCKNHVNLTESESEAFDKYLTNLPSVTLDNASGMDNTSEVFKVAKTVVMEVPNSRGTVTKIIFNKNTINLETVLVTILKTENGYYYIIEDTTANQPVGRLAKGAILLDDVRNSVIKLRDFNKTELKRRYIVRQK